jgi:hypothetical protein
MPSPPVSSPLPPSHLFASSDYSSVTKAFRLLNPLLRSCLGEHLHHLRLPYGSESCNLYVSALGVCWLATRQRTRTGHFPSAALVLRRKPERLYFRALDRHFRQNLMLLCLTLPERSPETTQGQLSCLPYHSCKRVHASLRLGPCAAAVGSSLKGSIAERGQGMSPTGPARHLSVYYLPALGVSSRSGFVQFSFQSA